MKRVALALLVLSGCYFPSAVTVSPGAVVSVSSFDPYLDPYGAWIDVPGYGRAWQPSPQYVGADFYPYGTGGQWLYTDAGWSFESDYPFGWAVFHYGRWMRDASYGWLWLPGTQWAPSWVSWRIGGPYVGWAPLGPYGALAYNYNTWCFVPTATFTVRNVRAYSTGYYDFHHAVAVTAPAHTGRAGPPPRYVSSATGTNITPVPVGSVGAGRAPPPPPPPSQGVAQTPMQVRPPPPPVGWRTPPNAPPAPSTGGFQSRAPPPPSSGGFQAPPPQYRTPPPTTFSAPRNYQAPSPAPAVPAPAPMQAPTRVQPTAPRSAPPPPSAMNAPAPPPPPAPVYRSAPAPAPAPPPSFHAPAPAPPPSSGGMHAPPPPPPRSH